MIIMHYRDYIALSWYAPSWLYCTIMILSHYHDTIAPSWFHRTIIIKSRHHDNIALSWFYHTIYHIDYYVAIMIITIDASSSSPSSYYLLNGYYYYHNKLLLWILTFPYSRDITIKSTQDSNWGTRVSPSPLTIRWGTIAIYEGYPTRRIWGI